MILEIRFDVKEIHLMMTDPPAGYRWVGLCAHNSQPVDVYMKIGTYWARYCLTS